VRVKVKVKVSATDGREKMEAGHDDSNTRSFGDRGRRRSTHMETEGSWCGFEEQKSGD
jgi:hypothetical protein